MKQEDFVKKLTEDLERLLKQRREIDREIKTFRKLIKRGTGT